MVLKTWIRIITNQLLWRKYTFSSFIPGDIILYRFIFVQNLKTWVKCILAIIYDHFSKTTETYEIMVIKT